MKVVSNSTTLVHLSAIGQLDLLRRLFGRIYIPHEVYQEVVVAGSGKPSADEVQAATWIEVRQVTNQLALSLLKATLGSGEAACIVLAAEMQADLVVLDDRLARIQAQEQGLKVVGTVGILLNAAERGEVEFTSALDSLLSSGFRLSPAEHQRVLALWRERLQEPR